MADPARVVPSLAAKSIRNTGGYHPTRNGVVVMVGGLVFIGTWSDRTLRAFDKETGKTLRARELPANSGGIPAVYESPGGSTSRSAGGPVASSAGKPKAAGYYLFALPRSPSTRAPRTASCS